MRRALVACVEQLLLFHSARTWTAVHNKCFYYLFSQYTRALFHAARSRLFRVYKNDVWPAMLLRKQPTSEVDGVREPSASLILLVVNLPPIKLSEKSRLNDAITLYRLNHIPFIVTLNTRVLVWLISAMPENIHPSTAQFYLNICNSTVSTTRTTENYLLLSQFSRQTRKSLIHLFR